MVLPFSIEPLSIEKLNVLPTDRDTGRTALATFDPPLANIPHERVPPLFTSDDPVKKPAVPIVDNVHAPKPVVLSF